MAAIGAEAVVLDDKRKEELEKELLALVKEGDVHSTLELAERWAVPHQKVVGIVKGLEALSMISPERVTTRQLLVTELGNKFLAEGSTELRIFRWLSGDGAGATKGDAASKYGAEFGNGFKECMRRRLVALDKGSGALSVLVEEEPEDEVQTQLQAVAAADGAEDSLAAKVVKGLKRRGLLELEQKKFFNVSRGSAWAAERPVFVAELTKEMLDDGSWEKSTFRSMNLKALGLATTGGYLHPLLKVRAELRSWLLEMGFREMPTNRWVESSFWNFDSLFQPQQHPCRDMHDTFFLSKPELALSVPEDYKERVKRTHEVGGYGSIGYHYDWKMAEARKNILRTHTTAVSSRMLYQMARDMEAAGGKFTPRKYFSIDRVFRNETLDATHLAEFHQVEGFVADYGLGLGDLLGTIAAFFERMGITKLRFKPAYNPYTEPSMEIFGYHPQLRKWTEIGNSGVFRPEMLLPMGLPEGVNVIAWGLSLERPTMIKYGISNIRDLFGHKVDLRSTRSAPLARF
eukprot:PLAT6954.1.p1 GENE.PLAT6954.1~~PLAT6954.1.p1  ORF type:complete len:516 (+),score=290.23 PLAT6954.1:60-1607(+)